MCVLSMLPGALLRLPLALVRPQRAAHVLHGGGAARVQRGQLAQHLTYEVWTVACATKKT